MSKIPSKNMEKLYREVKMHGETETVIRQKSRYYGTTCETWKLVRETMKDNATVYFELYHYGTKILSIETFHGVIDGVFNGNGYLATDRDAINSILYLFGINSRIKAHVVKDSIVLIKKDSSRKYYAHNGQGFYVKAGDLRIYLDE